MLAQSAEEYARPAALQRSTIDFDPTAMPPDEMTSRERVLTALDHREPDRLPIDFGGRFSTMHVFAHRKLKTFLGLEGGEEVIRNYFVYQALPDTRLMYRFQNDVLFFEPGPDSGWAMQIDPATNSYRDEWGVLYQMRPGGLFYDYAEHPLADATLDDIRRYPWPDPRDPGRTRGLAERVAHAHQHSGKAIMICPAIDLAWDQTQRLRGVEQALMDLALNRDIVEEMAERLTGWQKAHWDELLKAVGHYVDIVGLMDDYGGQSGPMFSPQVFRQIYKPRLKELISFIRQRTDAYIFLHSCGSVRWVIPDLIECGVDILNPLQVDAKDMQTDCLKRDFGDRLTFWGGGCDMHILARGTPRDVEREVAGRIRDLAPGGGYVFTSVHNLQTDVPPENVVAFYDSALKHGRYH
jgi:uroporphyrinogen decarboxylase